MTGKRFVYFIEAEGCGVIKVGSARSPERRLSQLRTGHVDNLLLRRVIDITGRPGVEGHLHQRWASLRVRGEWFRLEGDLKAFLDGELSEHGILPASPPQRRRDIVAGRSTSDPTGADAEYEEAVLRIGALMEGDPDPESIQGWELDILSSVVERYERARWPIPQATPVEVLKFMMEQNDRSQSDLADLLGSKSRASEILNGKRRLGLDHIRLLAREWHIPAGALIGELEDA